MSPMLAMSAKPSLPAFDQLRCPQQVLTHTFERWLAPRALRQSPNQCLLQVHAAHDEAEPSGQLAQSPMSAHGT